MWLSGKSLKAPLSFPFKGSDSGVMIVPSMTGSRPLNPTVKRNYSWVLRARRVIVLTWITIATVSLLIKLAHLFYTELDLFGCESSLKHTEIALLNSQIRDCIYLCYLIECLALLHNVQKTSLTFDLFTTLMHWIRYWCRFHDKIRDVSASNYCLVH